MSKIKKIVGILLAAVMVCAMSVAVFADNTTTGSITIKDSDNVSVAGKTFDAYQILKLTITGTDDDTTDADERGYVYTVPDEWKAFYLSYFTTLNADSGSFSADVVNLISGLNSEELYAFGVAASNYASTNNISATATATAGADDTSVALSGLDLGYYLVVDASTSGTISAVILDSTNTDITVTIKADEPTLDKTIIVTEDDPDTTDKNEEETSDYNNASVGDTVTFKLTSSVPDMTGYTKYYFVVTDTLSKGLTYADNMTITIGDTTLTKADAITTSTDNDGNVTVTAYTVTVDPTTNDVTRTEITDSTWYYVETSTDATSGETTVTITFHDFLQYASQKGAVVVITYDAILNEDANIGSTGNDNTAKLTYSNNPNETDNGDHENPDKPDRSSPTGETPESKTITYVTGIKLTKVNDAGDTLTGATFTLTGTTANKVQVTGEFYVEDDNGTYWRLANGTYTTTDPSTEGVDTSLYASTTQKYSKTTTSWVETQGTSAVTATATVDENGVLVFNGLSEGTYTITEIVAPNGYNLLDSPITLTISWTAPADVSTSEACTWTASYYTTDSSPTTNATVINGIITLTVENNAGSELPSTGGIGTTIFYIVGGILVVGAAILLITRARMRKVNE